MTTLASQPTLYPVNRIGVEVRQTDRLWKYDLAFNQDNQRRTLLRAERVVRNGESLLEGPNDEDRSDPARLTQTYLEQVNVNGPFRELVEFFSSIRLDLFVNARRG